MIIGPMEIRDDRQMKALTGLSKDDFHRLKEEFSIVYEQEQQKAYEAECKEGNRQRKRGGGQKGKLKTCAEKLLFILYYLKVYSTFDVLGTQFHMSRSSACKNVYKLAPILHNSLNNLGVLPRRKFNSVEEFREEFKEVEKIIIDALERSHQRPQDSKKQKEFYSGKKKKHTVKHTVISTVEKVIKFVGDSFPGSSHDYTMLKTEFSPELPWFEELSVLIDLGYQGIKTDYEGENIHIPHKKPRKSKRNPNPQLTEEQKTENRTVSQIRVFVEHAIGGMRRFAILVQAFRNRKDKFVDDVISLTAGLWNFSLLGDSPATT